MSDNKPAAADDLLKALDAHGESGGGLNEGLWFARRAASEIRRQSAELARLRAERDLNVRQCDAYAQCNKELKAEIARLRAAAAAMDKEPGNGC